MEFIIDFFRSIDGWTYYTILVVNAILIFAIIGYIGEKSNEQILKLDANKGNSNIKSGTMNLTPVHTTSTSSGAVVPEANPTHMPNQVIPQTPVATSSPAGTPTNNVSEASDEQIPAVLVINSSDVNKDVK